MKSILLSIQPYYCQLIIDGKKPIEVRKTKPKIECPFKVYLYETQGRKYSWGVNIDTIAKHDDDRFLDCRRGAPAVKLDKNNKPYFSYGRMAVIGEFTCDRIEKYAYFSHLLPDGNGMYYITGAQLMQTCLSYDEIKKYGNKKTLYGLHVSDLVIYDNPKSLNEFGLSRPPQSWCYVDEERRFLEGEIEK